MSPACNLRPIRTRLTQPHFPCLRVKAEVLDQASDDCVLQGWMFRTGVWAVQGVGRKNLRKPSFEMILDLNCLVQLDDPL